MDERKKEISGMLRNRQIRKITNVHDVKITQDNQAMSGIQK